jgi:hypothetical protein
LTRESTGYNANRPKPAELDESVTVPQVPDSKAPPATETVAPAPAPIGAGNEKPRVNADPYFPPLAPPPSELPKSELPKSEPPAPRIEPESPALDSHTIIGTTRCSLDYAVENAILGSQPRIEFWATRDNGRTWNRTLDESSGHSPARLVLPGDGDYGIRVKANGGGQPPRSGEAPDAWIEVDTTPPTVRMLPPTIGSGPDAGTLTIQWHAHDKNLVADSIRIYHASRLDGQWVPIATGLRNEGSFRWLIPAGIGADIYLRIEATDRAGNVGRFDLRDPVILPQPRVRVLGIGPAR